jgi:transcription initiation factor IIF auxiliary subunit
VFRNPPFEIREEGWGEFDMQIVLSAVEKGGDYTISHDLNFQHNSYDAKHTIVRMAIPVLALLPPRWPVNMQ